MSNQNLLQDPNYDPEKFLNWAAVAFGCKNDAQLSRRLESSPPTLSKMRNKRMPIGDSFLVRISDHTGMGTLAIKQHMFREVQP